MPGGAPVRASRLKWVGTKGVEVAHCGNKQCSHCQVVEAMLGREGEDYLTNKEIESDAQALGLKPDMALPNDHSRREDDEEWCTEVFQCGKSRLAPNLRPYCNTCCYDGGHHIFWSWRKCLGSGPGHGHNKPNRYQVVDVLYWCNGSRASA